MRTDYCYLVQFVVDVLRLGRCISRYISLRVPYYVSNGVINSELGVYCRFCADRSLISIFEAFHGIGSWRKPYLLNKYVFPLCSLSIKHYFHYFARIIASKPNYPSSSIVVQQKRYSVIEFELG